MRNLFEQGKLRERFRNGRVWQDHQRLQFEVIHNKDTTLFKSLLAIYRESIAKQPTPLLRWAYANCTSEISEHNIDSFSLREYALKKDDYLSEEKAIELHKQLIKDAPKQVLGYLGLARAYKAGFFDPEPLPYYKVLSEKWETTKVNGRTVRIKRISTTNPERFRRYRQLRDKVRQMEPKNPFVYYWDALSLLRTEDFTKVFESVVEAYQLGMNQLLPIDCLGLIVWCAYKAGLREDMERYRKELQRWAAQAPKSPYVREVRQRWVTCPAIQNLSTN